MEYYFGFLIGAGLIIIIVALILKQTKTDGSMKCKFDERQQIVRGIGFKYGFFTLAIYNFIAGFYVSFAEKTLIENGALHMIGLFAGVFVYAVYCIWHEGYFSLNENPKRVMISFALLALINFAVGFRGFSTGVLFNQGISTINCLNIFCGILLLLILLVLAAKHISRKKEERE